MILRCHLPQTTSPRSSGHAGIGKLGGTVKSAPNGDAKNRWKYIEPNNASEGSS